MPALLMEFTMMLAPLNGVSAMVFLTLPFLKS